MATISNTVKWASNLNQFAAEQERAIAATLRHADQVNHSVKTIEGNTGRLHTSMAGIGKAMAGLFTVTAIAGAVKHYADFTGKLTDLSVKTGIGVEELQRLKFAAEQSGGTLEGVTAVIGKMARHLVEGDAGAVGAMKRLGLNLNEIRQMQPGEAFLKIGEAIARIPNPMEQSTLAMQLFGKSGADVLPMLKSGMSEAAAAAERLGIVMDAQTVAAGDRLGDTFTALSAVGQGVIGKVLAPLVPAIQSVADAMTGAGNVVTWLQGAFQTLIEWALRGFKAITDGAIKVGEMAGRIPVLGSALKALDQDTLASAKSMSQWLDDTIKGMQIAIPPAAKATHTLRTAVGLLTDEQQKNTKAAEAHLKALDRAALAGVEAYRTYHAAVRETADAINTLVATSLANSPWGERQRAMLSASTDATAQWITFLRNGIPVVSRLGKEFANVGEQVDVAFTPIPSRFEAMRDTADLLAASLRRLGQSTGGVFGAILQGAGAAISAFGDMADATDTFRRLAKASFAQTAAYALELATSLAGWVQVSVNLIERLYDSLTAKEAQAVLSARGGIHQLRADAALAGTVLGELPDKASAFREAIERLDRVIAQNRARMDRYNLTWRDFSERIRQTQIDQMTRTLITDFRHLERQIGSAQGAAKAMGGALNQLVIDAVRTGTRIPVALQPILEQLIRMGGLTEDAARAMLGLEADTMPALADVKEAAERYGLTLDQLGPKVSQLRITETATQIVKDFDLLMKAGADVAVVMDAMKGQVQKLVTEALTLGLALPESMRSLIQHMINAGLLTDEFGVKLTDVSRLTFAETLASKIDQLIQKLGELIDHMSKVGTAAEEGFGRARGAAEALGKAIPRGVLPPAVPRESVEGAPGAKVARGLEGAIPDEFGPFEPAARAALGGLVTMGRVLPFHAGGLVPTRAFDLGGIVPRVLDFTPTGTDTVPALLTPGEIVLTAAQQRHVAADLRATGTDGREGPVTINLTVQAWDRYDLDRAIEEQVVPKLVRAIGRNTGGAKSHLKGHLGLPVTTRK